MKPVKLNMRVVGLVLALAGGAIVFFWRAPGPWPGFTVAVIGLWILTAGNQRERRQQERKDQEVRERLRQKRQSDRPRGGKSGGGPSA
ncbi:MAG TPA: hypothetical protein VGL40_13975 [Bacillota bacterium]